VRALSDGDRVTPIRVMLADDHALFRAGIRSLLETIEGVEIVGEARDGHEALRMVAERGPDVLLLDVGLPELNGIEVAERLRETPGTRVLILSMFANEEFVLRSLRAGAVGYLLKDSTVEELATALRSVADGGSYLSPAVSGHVLAAYVRRVGDQDVPADPTLTPRQREVLQLIAEGHGTKEIAARLNLSAKTVETHRAQLMERLGIRDVAGLVRYAIRSGIVSADKI
jgi:DNA-binding NarL/FixJ family response regulator